MVRILISLLLFLSGYLFGKNDDLQVEKIDTIFVMSIIPINGFLDSTNFMEVSTTLIRDKLNPYIWDYSMLNVEIEKRITKKAIIQWLIYKDLMKKAGYVRLDSLSGKKLNKYQLENFLSVFEFEKMKTRNTKLDSIFVRVIINDYGIISREQFNSLSNKFNLETIIEGEKNTQMIYGDILPSRSQIEKDFSEIFKEYRKNQWQLYKSEIKRKFNRELLE